MFVVLSNIIIIQRAFYRAKDVNNEKKNEDEYPTYKLLNNVDIYVVRIYLQKNKKEIIYKTKNSKPCKHCISFMKSIGIRNIFYSTNNGWECESVKRLKTEHISIANRHS